MAIREFINKSPVLAGVTVLAVVILAAALAFVGTRRVAPRNAVFSTHAFYSTDDGATLFTDDAGRDPPFDHDGKQAVRAHVFSCDNGYYKWVQYLEKNSSNAPAPSPPGGSPTPQAVQVLVKKPGSSNWIVRGMAGCLDVMVPKRPDGADSGNIQPVLPKP